MTDSFGREIEYMRVSVTDRCNLRCKYCMPRDLPSVPHDDVLRYEEILRLCAIAARTGIRAVRVTGGEPLARKGCVGFIRELVKVPGIERVSMTTNGVLLEPYVRELGDIGISGVNLSLDSLDAGTYRAITGFDEFSRVWRSFLALMDARLSVKINCVPISGVNSGEIEAIAGLAGKYPVDIRFIELMPTGAGVSFIRISGAEILKRLKSAYPDLSPDSQKRGMGPAGYYTSGGLIGRLGIISAIDNCFCKSCNRVRLTGEGFLKTCLFHEDGVSLRGLLRAGAGDSELEDAFRSAVLEKPEHHAFESGRGGIKNMAVTGG